MPRSTVTRHSPAFFRAGLRAFPKMSEGEAKQVPSSGSDTKPDSGPGLASMSPPMAASAPQEEEEEESEDESEILEESPCGRWQKRREEVCVGGDGPGLGGKW